MNTFRNERLDVTVKSFTHTSGLTVKLCPKPDFGNAYAMISAKFGSDNNCFFTEEGEVTLPDGTAHFLEHKLFQNKDGTDAFELFARTGANANAYTSNEKTSYLFSCTDRFRENLSILLGFVFEPYFTEESVQKERGIIGQEIAMYRDDPSWQALLGVLGGLYRNHPLRLDVAGSEESIAQISPSMLYLCHRTFYRPENMVLTVVGNFDEQDVFDVCDEKCRTVPPLVVRQPEISEPPEIAREVTKQTMDLSIPYFQIGFKLDSRSPRQNQSDTDTAEMLADLLAGDASPLYRRLYDEGLINDAFDSEVFSGDNYFSLLFSGESHEPQKVQKALLEEILRVKRDGFSDEDFIAARNALYGRYVRLFDSLSATAEWITDCHFSSVGVFDVIDRLENARQSDAKALLARLLPEHCALSVIEPKGV